MENGDVPNFLGHLNKEYLGKVPPKEDFFSTLLESLSQNREGCPSLGRTAVRVRIREMGPGLNSSFLEGGRHEKSHFIPRGRPFGPDAAGMREKTGPRGASVPIPDRPHPGRQAQRGGEGNPV